MQTTLPDPSLQKEKKDKKVGYSLAGSLSLFIHLALVLLIGGTVIVEHIIPPTPMPVADVFPTPPVTKPQEDTPPPIVNDNPTPDDPDPGTPAPFPNDPYQTPVVTTDFPTTPFLVPTGNPIVGQWPPTSPNKPDSKPNDTLRPPKAAELFNFKFETAKLGVILDCSGSAHGYLMAALKEIDKNFDNAPTVLAMGCGMGATKTGEVQVELYGKIKPDKERDRAGSRTILGQLATAEAKYQDLAKYLDRMKKRKDVWAIYGGDVNATAFGFEELIAQGVDTIYWFSDLADAVNPQMFEKLIAECKRKNIKVIVHNFSGKPVPALQAKMAMETGGTAISQIPK